ncbi:MAG: helix-turn-helix transcriptional regulator [archaeon]
MLKTNIDKILDILRTKKEMPVSEIAQQIGTSQDSVMNTAENMEDEGLVRIEYKLMRPYLILNDKISSGNMNELTKDQEDDFSQLSDKKYAILDDTEIESSMFKKEITPQQCEHVEKKEPEQPKIIVINNIQAPKSEKNGSDYYSSYSSAKRGEEKETGEKYQEEKEEDTYYKKKDYSESVFDKAQSPKDEKEFPTQNNLQQTQAANSVASVYDEIESLIAKAETLIDIGDASNVNDLYSEIYSKFTKESLSDEEKMLLKGKIIQLYQKIRQLYA